MAKALANVRIYGDADGAVFVAPKSTTMPTGLVEPAVDFAEIGWINEDGVNIANESENAEFNAWQGGKLLRVRVTSSSDQFTFNAVEENAAVLGLYLPNATFTTATGVTTIVPADGVSSDERCFVLDFHDGDVQKRYNVIRGEVTERGEVVHQNTEMTAYQFTVKMYEYEIVTNNPAVAVATT